MAGTGGNHPWGLVGFSPVEVGEFSGGVGQLNDDGGQPQMVERGVLGALRRLQAVDEGKFGSGW